MRKTISAKEQKRLFSDILTRHENLECADCGAKGPCWVSLDFGTVVCIKCSGEHRRLGMHITRIRSCKLDSWTAEDICMVEGIGNANANAYWENKRGPVDSKPNPSSSMEARRKFINKKYIKKLWVPEGYQDPVSEYKQALIEDRAPNFPGSANEASPAKQSVEQAGRSVNTNQAVRGNASNPFSQNYENDQDNEVDLMSFTPAKQNGVSAGGQGGSKKPQAAFTFLEKSKSTQSPMDKNGDLFNFAEPQLGQNNSTGNAKNLNNQQGANILGLPQNNNNPGIIDLSGANQAQNGASNPFSGPIGGALGANGMNRPQNGMHQQDKFNAFNMLNRQRQQGFANGYHQNNGYMRGNGFGGRNNNPQGMYANGHQSFNSSNGFNRNNGFNRSNGFGNQQQRQVGQNGGGVKFGQSNGITMNTGMNLVNKNNLNNGNNGGGMLSDLKLF